MTRGQSTILISMLPLSMHGMLLAWCWPDLCGFPLRMNGMNNMQFDHMYLALRWCERLTHAIQSFSLIINFIGVCSNFKPDPFWSNIEPVCLWNAGTVLPQLYQWTTLLTMTQVNCIDRSLALNTGLSQCRHRKYTVSVYHV